MALSPKPVQTTRSNTLLESRLGIQRPSPQGCRNPLWYLSPCLSGVPQWMGDWDQTHTAPGTVLLSADLAGKGRTQSQPGHKQSPCQCPEPTFSKYLTSYSVPLGVRKPGSCHDKETLFCSTLSMRMSVTGVGTENAERKWAVTEVLLQ